MLSREGKLQQFLRKLKKNGEIDNTMHKDIYPTGSQPAQIYRLLKMHKVREPAIIYSSFSTDRILSWNVQLQLG